MLACSDYDTGAPLPTSSAGRTIGAYAHLRARVTFRPREVCCGRRGGSGGRGGRGAVSVKGKLGENCGEVKNVFCWYQQQDEAREGGREGRSGVRNSLKGTLRDNGGSKREFFVVSI